MKFRIEPIIALMALCLFACDSSDGGSTEAVGGSTQPMEGLGGPTAGTPPAMTTGGSDQFMAMGGSSEMSSSMPGGTMTAPSGGSDNPPPVMPDPNMDPPPSPVNDCASACARYVECGKAVDVFGEGGEAVCVQECERATRGGVEPAQAW